MGGRITLQRLSPRTRTALPIIAGRGASRGCIMLSVLVLLPVWGIEEFGRYVSAVGTFTWLILLVTGVEKAGLTALPRTSLLSRQCTRMLLGRAAAPMATAIAAAALLAPAGRTPAMFGMAAVWTSGQGLLSVLAAFHRLIGHPGRDSAAFSALAVWVVGATSLAIAGVLDPYGYLLTLATGAVADCAALALLLPALRGRAPRRRRGRRLGMLINRRVLLLGLSDVADTASVSVLYLAIAAVGRPADSAAVYLVMVVSVAFGGLVMLVLRLRQPVTSLRLRGLGGERGRRRAGRIIAWSAAITGAAAALAVGGVLAAYLLSGPGAVAAIGSSPLALAAGVGVEMTVFCAVMYAVYLLENTNGAALSVTSSSAAAGLVATTVAAFAAIPALHAVGAMLALVIGLAAKTGLLHLRLPNGQGDRVLDGRPGPERALHL